MSLKLVKRNGRPQWHIRGSFRGVRVSESTETCERVLAEEILLKRSGEIQQRFVLGDLGTRTFAEAALSYLEGGGEARHLDRILVHFGEMKLIEINLAAVDKAARLLKPAAGPATLNRQIYTPITAVLNHAARLGWATKPVFRRPKQPNGRVRSITQEEANKLVSCAAPHMRPLVVFLLLTGARLSEALYLQWSEVDLRLGQVTFKNTKNGETRSVPLHPRAQHELTSVPWDRSGSVFRRPAGKVKQAGRVWLPYERRENEAGDKIGGGQVKTAWAGMCRRAGLDNFTPHDCRHTWATWYYQEHRDPFQLMALGGWKSVEMVHRYAHTNVQHQAAAIGALWGNKR